MFFSLVLLNLGGAGAWAADGLPSEIVRRAAAVRIPFIENQGQIAGQQVGFYARTFGGVVGVTRDGELVYVLTRPESHVAGQAPAAGLPRWERGKPVTLRENLVNARIASIQGDTPAAARYSSFCGSNPEQWRSHLPAYETVRLGEVYPGIEFSVRAWGNTVEKLFQVAPGARPDQIRVKLRGGRTLQITAGGELEILTDQGPIRFSAPEAYQLNQDHGQEAVAIAYRLQEDTFGFEVGAYDPTRALTIDPLLASTFIGGGNADYCRAVAVDSAGNVYIAGTTWSSDFPVTNASQSAWAGQWDAFVSKFDSRLTNLIASTFLGGASNDVANTLAVTAGGTVYVAGYTDSTNFPVQGGPYQGSSGGGRDGFAARLSADLGTVDTATYLGGSGLDTVNGIAVDSLGYVFLGGYTESANFPMASSGAYTNYWGAGDGFVSRMDAFLASLPGGTFLGTNGQDCANALAVDNVFNHVWVAGYTGSTNFPHQNVYGTSYKTNSSGSNDVFVTRLTNPLTNILASTYIGGVGQDAANAIVLESSNTVYIAGYSWSTNYPTANGPVGPVLNGECDVVVSRLSFALTNLAASTYLGGTGVDLAYGLTLGVVTNRTNVTVVGYTLSADYAVTPNAYSRTLAGGADAFVSTLSLGLSNIYASTYLGGSGNDEALAVATGATGTVLYVVGDTASSNNFPVSDAAYGTRYAGGAADGFVTKLASSVSYGSQKWRTEVWGQIYSTPATGPDGTIYVGSLGGLFYAIDPDTGFTNHPVNLGANPIYGSPVVGTNGNVYVGCNDDKFYAFDADLNTLWSTNLGGNIDASAALDTNGNLYVGLYTAPFTFNKISPNGTVLWSTNLGGSGLSSPAIGTNNVVYVGSAVGFDAYNMQTGERLWRRRYAEEQFESSPAIGSNGIIYVGSISNRLYAFNPDGTTNWIFTAAGAVYSSPAIGTNGAIYVGGGANFYALTSAGSQLKVWATGGTIRSAPALGQNGTMYVAAGDGYLYAFNPDGSTNWIFNIQADSLLASPMIGMDGTVYIGSGDAYLFAVFGAEPPATASPWYKFHHDIHNTGRVGYNPAPAAPTLTASKAAYTNRVLIAWTAVPYATVYELYRSRTNDTNTAEKIISTRATNYFDYGVDPGYVYYYWAKAKSPLGFSGFSASDYGGIVPLAPTGVSATKGGPYTNTIAVSWSNSAGDGIGYELWRALTNSGAAKVANVPGTNFTDTATNSSPITLGLRYYYWVKATNVVGTSDLSAYDYGGTPPLSPVGLSAGQGVSSNGVLFSWNASTGAEFYAVSRYHTTNSLLATNLTVTAGLSWFDTDVYPPRRYYYWTRATNEFGQSGFSAYTIGWSALRPPTNVAATKGVYLNKIGVSWNAETYAASYAIYRSLSNQPAPAALLVEIPMAAGTSYEDLEIIQGQTYYYWLKSTNAYGASEFSAGDFGGTTPLAPSGIFASDGTYLDKIELTWSASAWATVGYAVFRGTTPDPSYATPLPAPITDTRYNDTTATPGLRYYYWAASINAFGTSSWCEYNTGWRLLAPPAWITAAAGAYTNHLIVTWAPSENAIQYELWRATNNNVNAAGALVVLGMTTSYDNATADAGKVYYYWVKAKNYSFISDFSASAAGYRALGAVDLAADNLVYLPAINAVGRAPDAVSFRVRNLGSQAMTPPNTAIRADFYLSTSPIHGGGAQINLGHVTRDISLSVGSATTLALTAAEKNQLLIPAVAPGTYYLFVYVQHTLPSTWLDPDLSNNWAARYGGPILVSLTPGVQNTSRDYNGDGKTDLAVYSETNGLWFVRTADGTMILNGENWGAPGYLPVPGDFDGDGQADPALYNAASSNWYVRLSSAGYATAVLSFGAAGWRPAEGDFDGDRKADPTMYSETVAQWAVRPSSGGYQPVVILPFGSVGFYAISGDFDGDSRTDPALYGRESGIWTARLSAGGYTLVWAPFGGSEFQPVPADYDADGRTDLAVFHRPSGYWFIMAASGRQILWGEYWGPSDAMAVPGDYDGDGAADLAVYVESSGLWSIRTVSGAILLQDEMWGAPGYKPISSER